MSGNNCQVFLTYDRMLLPPQKFNNTCTRLIACPLEDVHAKYIRLTGSGCSFDKNK